MGFRIPLVLFRIPKPTIFVSTRQCFPDSESGNPYMERNILIRKFNFQLFPPTSCFKEFCWYNYLHFHIVFRRICYIAFVTSSNLFYHYHYEVETNSLFMHFICLSMQQDQNKQISRKSRLIIKRNTIPMIMTDNEKLNFKESSKRNNYSGLKEFNICWP